MSQRPVPGRTRIRSDLLFPRVESGNLLAPDEVAARITNMVATPEGSLRGVVGPAPYLPWNGTTSDFTGENPLVSDGTISGNHNFFADYNDTHGIFHAVVQNGTREILLLHSGKEMWSFEGWEKGWRVLLGTGRLEAGNYTQSNVRYKTSGITNNSSAQPPTQFEAAPNGVIIVPQGDRAYFYDGVTVAPLGYDRAPGAPLGLGPKTTSSQPQSFKYTKASGEAFFKNPWDTNNFADDAKEHSDFTTPMRNDGGYAHDAQRGYYQGWPEWRSETQQNWICGTLLTTGMHPAFGRCYVGTVSFPEGMAPLSIDFGNNQGAGALAAVNVPSTVGILLDGEYYGAAQWVDQWGNLSPVSQRSNVVQFERQVSAAVQTVGTPGYGTMKNNRRPNQVPGAGELVAKQIGWTAIEPGPVGTVGRILYRTRDTLNSGTNDLFEVPPNASGGITAYSTLPDNITTFYSDNVSDARLRNPAPDLVPVPNFKLCRIALGRLWVAGIDGAPGMIRPSLPGLWGTFPANQEIFPDPSGGEITVLWSSPNGLIAFTRSSIYLISANGLGFATRALSLTLGCVAPDSIAEMPGGMLLWLGADGFYSMSATDTAPRLISANIGDRTRNFNVARVRQAVAAFDPTSQEYRCWVPADGTARNSVCFAYDGQGWRERTDMYEVTGVCTTRNHQSYMLVCGRANGTAQFTKGPGIYGTASYENHSVVAEKQEAQNGVWVLDRENHTWIPDPLTSTIETSWIGAGTSQQRKSIIKVYLWLRETQRPSEPLLEAAGQATPALPLQVSVYVDWRKSRTIKGETVVTPVAYSPMYPEDDPPPAWGQESWSGTAETWKRRRPFWAKVEVAIPSCEVFKLKLEPNSEPNRFEFIGLSFDMIPRGERMPKVTETF